MLGRAHGACAVQRIFAFSMYSSPVVLGSSSGGTSSAMRVRDQQCDSEAGENAASGLRCSGGRTGDGGDLGNVDMRTSQRLTNPHVQFCKRPTMISLLKTQWKRCSPVAEIAQRRPVGPRTEALGARTSSIGPSTSPPLPESPCSVARGGRERQRRYEILERTHSTT